MRQQKPHERRQNDRTENDRRQQQAEAEQDARRDAERPKRLTDEQCNAFRRLPLNFNDMVRAIHQAGHEASPSTAALDWLETNEMDVQFYPGEQDRHWWIEAMSGKVIGKGNTLREAVAAARRAME